MSSAAESSRVKRLRLFHNIPTNQKSKAELIRLTRLFLTVFLSYIYSCWSPHTESLVPSTFRSDFVTLWDSFLIHFVPGVECVIDQTNIDLENSFPVSWHNKSGSRSFFRTNTSFSRLVSSSIDRLHWLYYHLWNIKLHVFEIHLNWCETFWNGNDTNVLCWNVSFSLTASKPFSLPFSCRTAGSSHQAAWLNVSNTLQRVPRRFKLLRVIKRNELFFPSASQNVPVSIISQRRAGDQTVRQLLHHPVAMQHKVWQQLRSLSSSYHGCNLDENRGELLKIKLTELVLLCFLLKGKIKRLIVDWRMWGRDIHTVSSHPRLKTARSRATSTSTAFACT